MEYSVDLMDFHPTHEAYLAQLESEVGPGSWLYGSECCETNPLDNVHQNKFENMYRFMQQCFWQWSERIFDD
eukprot:1624555-Prorocentrum_lima.AAC.1